MHNKSQDKSNQNFDIRPTDTPQSRNHQNYPSMANKGTLLATFHHSNPTIYENPKTHKIPLKLDLERKSLDPKEVHNAQIEHAYT